ncbi:MAG: hypothetical protein OXI57_01015 [Rhodospirillales bacterium]|nr:hypothetical protein [Rhodospirillales bacterium]
MADVIPDMTLSEIAAHLEREHGLRVSQSTVWRFFLGRWLQLCCVKDRAAKRAQASPGAGGMLDILGAPKRSLALSGW